MLTSLIDRYEEHHFPIQMKDPVLALLNLIKEQNIERKELPIALIGKSKVSKVLNRKRSYLAL